MINYNQCFFTFEPKPVPRTDRDGNVVGYDYPDVMPCTLYESDDLRVKRFPNEKGCTADPSNVQGFQETLKIINEHRNTRTSGLSEIGNDACGMMEYVESVVRNSKTSNSK